VTDSDTDGMHILLLELGMGYAGKGIGEFGVDVGINQVWFVIGCDELLLDSLVVMRAPHSRS
jgi:hypothetical protein